MRCVIFREDGSFNEMVLPMNEEYSAVNAMERSAGIEYGWQYPALDRKGLWVLADETITASLDDSEISKKLNNTARILTGKDHYGAIVVFRMDEPKFLEAFDDFSNECISDLTDQDIEFLEGVVNESN